jgi:ribosomal protein L40E
MHCRHCGATNPRLAVRCSNCGRSLHKSLWRRLRRAVARRLRGRSRYQVLLVLLVLLAIYFFIYRLAAPALFPDLPQAE